MPALLLAISGFLILSIQWEKLGVLFQFMPINKSKLRRELSRAQAQRPDLVLEFWCRHFQAVWSWPSGLTLCASDSSSAKWDNDGNDLTTEFLQEFHEWIHTKCLQYLGYSKLQINVSYYYCCSEKSINTCLLTTRITLFVNALCYGLNVFVPFPHTKFNDGALVWKD